MTILNYSKRCLIFISFFLVIFSGSTQAVVTLHAEQSFMPRDGYGLSYFLDSSNTLTLEQIQQLQSEQKFSRLEKGFSFGYRSDSLWLYLPLNNVSATKLERYIEVPFSFLDRVELYQVVDGALLSRIVSGDSIAQSQKSLASLNPAFVVNLLPGLNDIYIRVKTTSALAGAVNIYTHEEFEEKGDRQFFAYGMFFGSAFLFAIVSLSFGLVRKRMIFLVYFGFLLSALLEKFSTLGLMGYLILPEQPEIAGGLVGFFIGVAAVFATIFFIMLFKMKQRHPYLFKLMLLILLISMITIISVPLGYYQQTAPLLLLGALLTVLMAPRLSYAIVKAKEPYSPIILVGYLIYVVSLGLTSLYVLGFLSYSDLYPNAGLFTVFAHALITFFALVGLAQNDIKQREKASEESKLAAVKQAEMLTKLEEQKRFMAMLAHEFKNPLANIRLNLELIKSSEESRRLSRCIGSIDRMNRIIDRCNSEIETHYLDDLIFKKEVDLKQLLEDEIEFLNLRSDVRVHIDTDKCSIISDPDMISVVLKNILENASKYRLPHSMVDVALSSWSDSHVKLAVVNTTRHSHSFDAELIFERYYRHPKDLKHDGSGLGLFIVKSICHKLDIAISAKIDDAKFHLELEIPIKTGGGVDRF